MSAPGPGPEQPAILPPLPEVAGGRIAVRALAPGRTRDFELVPDASALGTIAAAIGARGLRKLRLAGSLTPEGRADWRLEAHLGATVEQECVVTLAPVRTRIESDLRRLYRATRPASAPGPETESPDETDEEPLGREIDLVALIAEEVALAMPDYPRAPDASDPVDLSARPQDATPDSPFAVLARLTPGSDDRTKG
ncbi:MAG: DUF177 domain-containing protein [Rhodobacteraceae bacterium]|nr:DUF177 domain-containing protein [Paracoccaceae bacterium]